MGLSFLTFLFNLMGFFGMLVPKGKVSILPPFALFYELVKQLRKKKINNVSREPISCLGFLSCLEEIV